LGLIQIGVKNAIYLVDVITLPQALKSLKSVLEDSGIQKVVWDGRMDFSELWHGHGIKLAGVLDLQLLGVYQGQSRGIPGPRGYIALDGLFAKFRRMNAVIHETSVDFSRINKSLPLPNSFDANVGSSKTTSKERTTAMKRNSGFPALYLKSSSNTPHTTSSNSVRCTKSMNPRSRVIPISRRNRSDPLGILRNVEFRWQCHFFFCIFHVFAPILLACLGECDCEISGLNGR
jgi:3'-5' exonuclease